MIRKLYSLTHLVHLKLLNPKILFIMKCRVTLLVSCKVPTSKSSYYCPKRISVAEEHRRRVSRLQRLPTPIKTSESVEKKQGTGACANFWPVRSWAGLPSYPQHPYLPIPHLCHKPGQGHTHKAHFLAERGRHQASPLSCPILTMVRTAFPLLLRQ